jgi:cobalt-zinc-cadmium efflux system outer membrane protein
MFSGLKAQSVLDPYFAEAGKNNPELSGLFSTYLAALEKLPQVKALPDPQLAMAYFLQPVETRMGPQQFRLSLSQLFPWFGSLSAAERELAEEAKAKLELFEEAKSRLFHEIQVNYYELFLSYEVLKISTDNLQVLESLNRLILIKIEGAKASSLDEIRIQMEMGDLTNQLAKIEDRIEVQWRKFDNLINSPGFGRPEVIQSVEIPDLEVSKDEIWETILSKNHQLLKTEFELTSLAVKKERAELEGMPDFNLGIEYIAVGKGDMGLQGKDAWVFPRVGISIPLYRDKYRAKVQEVVHLSDSKNFFKQNQINGLNNSLESSFADYQDAIRRIDLFQTQSQLAKRALDLLETEYASASKPFEEVLRMERKLLGYSLELAKAHRDKAMAISYINYLMGF